MTALKIAYLVLVVISALIVVGYCIVTFAIRPPDVEGNKPPAVTGGNGSGSLNGTENSAAPSSEPGLSRRKEVYTCLIFGMDDGNGNTDTIMVATFDVPNHTIGLVSVPRDTIVRTDRSGGWNKVNTAYAIGGVDQLKQELSELLGIPIDYYVKIQLKAFQKLVDAVGGVYFDVPFYMKYSDPTQDLYIDQPAGYRLLSGKDAMEVVRFRQTNTDASFSDVGRVGVQQAFVKAMLSQVVSRADLTTIPELVDVLFNYVETDAQLSDALYFARSVVGVDMNSAITTGTLPAVWHYPYMWVDQQEEALEMINSLLNVYDGEITRDMVEFLER